MGVVLRSIKKKEPKRPFTNALKKRKITPEQLTKLSGVAERNSFAKYSGFAVRGRTGFARVLRQYRSFDQKWSKDKKFALQLSVRETPESRKKKWVMTFRASLAELSKTYYARDIVAEIIKHSLSRKKGYVVAEIGCGDGKAASQLQGKIGGFAKVIATGLRRMPDWKKQPNASNVEWHVAQAENLSKRIPPNSVDFVHSNFALTHAIPYAFNPSDALAEVHKILKPKGRLLMTGNTGHFLVSPPNGFRYVVKPYETKEKNTVYYLEKI